MVITLTITGESEPTIIKIGSSNPTSTTYYVQAPNSYAVATVDALWYDVLSSLVTDPPYANTEEETTSTTADTVTTETTETTTTGEPTTVP
jgi:hypothetical protein